MQTRVMKNVTVLTTSHTKLKALFVSTQRHICDQTIVSARGNKSTTIVLFRFCRLISRL